MKIIKYIPVIVTLSGAAGLQAEIYSHDDSDEREIIDTPTAAAFSVCFDHSCNSVETHSITAEEWKRVIAPLETPALSADKERDAIAAAIAIMEGVVGHRTGTYQDLAENLPGFGKSGQMDCIDESTNTTTYLYMLEKAGYLKWHRLADRSTRFGIFAGMPHTTAVIRETGTGTLYSVDSWFFDNGFPPAVVKLSVWKKGWRPGDTLN